MNSSSAETENFEVSVPEEFLKKLETLTPLERSRFETLRLEWENWRIGAESIWREKFRSREIKIRQQCEVDANTSLSDRSEDLRRTHDDIAKLEMKLRNAVDSIEEKKLRLQASEEQVSLRLAQKTAELQLLQRRVRDEAKMKIETEAQRAEGLQHQLDDMKAMYERVHERAQNLDSDFEAYRQQVRSVPDTQLREDLVSLKARYSDGLAQIERERSLTSEAEIEKEHYRAQMHRLALALKTERDRSSDVARQELEQLRLEFLAREERYILDGDRAALGDIRKEIDQLRKISAHGEDSGIRDNSRSEEKKSEPPTLPSEKVMGGAGVFVGGGTKAAAATEKSSSSAGLKLALVNKQLSSVLASGMYDDENDPLVLELTKSLLNALQK